MSNRVAIVTGGSRGIGAAIAERLAKEDFNVTITYSSSKGPAEEVAEKIRQHGVQAHVMKANGGHAEDNKRIIAETAEKFGRVDVLVCNAGAYPNSDIADMSVEDVEKTLNLNMRGPVIETVEALKHMGKGGRIIYMGSAHGGRSALPGVALYCATKAAMRGLARGVARDVGPKGITANVIEPGPINTSMNSKEGDHAAAFCKLTALGRYGETPEIASTVAFLVSPEASYITGAAIPVDGGMEA